MSTGVWNTESDLLEDIMELAGNANVDENYIVRGSGPPPVLREQEDEEELMCQFGVTNGSSDVSYGQPDLKGIQEMVRMVNYNNSDNNVGCESEIVISKLNPNSPEFIPNAGQGKVNGNNNNKVADEKQFDESNLREKIQNASKAKNKLEKNVAVISLLKLHATRTNQNDKTPNLLTPDYFKNPLNAESSQKPSTEVPTNSNTETTASPNRESTKLVLDNSDVQDAEAEIKNSVDKVNDWLNPQKPIVTKSLKPHLEPITFRRKTVRGNCSPNPSGSQVKVARNDYVPSDYARELTEMYTKRVEERKAVVQKSNLITLDNLEEKLRVRDEKIRASLNNHETESNPRL